MVDITSELSTKKWTSRPSYQALKRILERSSALHAANAAAERATLTQQGAHIRSIGEYQAFWDEYSAEAAR